jgi:tetratricopeptide (TPR) repeat protein
VRDKALSIIAAVPLIIQLAGCATSPAAQADGKAASVAADGGTKSALSDTQNTKAFTEAVQRGDAAWQAQDLDRAVYYYVRAMDKSPRDAPTLAKIGAIEDLRGNAALAERAFEMAHNADPEEPHIAERLARLYLKGGKIDRAAEIYTQVLARDLHRPRALDGMGEVCLARSDYGQSILYFNRALQADKPDVAGVLTQRGYAKLRSNDLTGAETDLRAALAVPPREDAWVAPRGDAWRYLGDVQVLRGDAGGALESLLNVMDTAEAFNEIGATLMSVKKYQDAKEYFTKAIAASAAWFEAAQKNLALVNERLRNSAG